MSLPEKKPALPLALIVDAVLCLAFFGLLFGILRSHVQSNDARIVAFWAGATATCMTAVFWLAVQMFRVVARAQREAAQRQ